MISRSLKNIIDQHMNSLPHDVQEAIHGSSWERKILDIGRRYGLHVDQLEILQTELSLAVLGLSDRQSFIREVTSEAHIPKETMFVMVEDINREIFEPIRDHLKKTRQKNYEVDRESEHNTASGLHEEEETLLQQHGLSFSLEEDEKVIAPAPLISSTVTEKQEDIVQENYPKPILEKPLVLNKDIPKTSLDNLLQNSTFIKNIHEDEDSSMEEGDTQNVSLEKKVIPGIDIDLNTLPSAKTLENQKKIEAARNPIYEKDPYREPI